MWREEKWSLQCGAVTIQWPAQINQLEIGQLEAWFNLLLRKMEWDFKQRLEEEALCKTAKNK